MPKTCDLKVTDGPYAYTEGKYTKMRLTVKNFGPDDAIHALLYVTVAPYLKDKMLDLYEMANGQRKDVVFKVPGLTWGEDITFEYWFKYD